LLSQAHQIGVRSWTKCMTAPVFSVACVHNNGSIFIIIKIGTKINTGPTIGAEACVQYLLLQFILPRFLVLGLHIRQPLRFITAMATFQPFGGDHSLLIAAGTNDGIDGFVDDFRDFVNPRIRGRLQYGNVAFVWYDLPSLVLQFRDMYIYFFNMGTT